jgi:hypothetical protein
MQMLSFTFDESLLDGQVGVATMNGEATFSQTTVTAEGDDSVNYASTDAEQSGAPDSGDGSVDWGDTAVENGASGSSDAASDTGSSDTGTADAGGSADTSAASSDDGTTGSSDATSSDEEEITVSAWVPRSDFDTAA